MAINPANRALTEEQKKKKYPLEWALRESYAEYLTAEPESLGMAAQEKVLYSNLVKLSKAVIVHKYGSRSRIEYDTLPHDIASSLMVTIVMRRKEVFSWTNLMKKVARDAVSNHLRKEYYHGMSFIELDSGDGDLDPGDPGSDDCVATRYEFDSSIKVDDLIYVKQLVTECNHGLYLLFDQQQTLKMHLLFKLALHEVSTRERHYLVDVLPVKYFYRYNYLVAAISMELAPVLSSKYLSKILHT